MTQPITNINATSTVPVAPVKDKTADVFTENVRKIGEMRTKSIQEALAKQSQPKSAETGNASQSSVDEFGLFKEAMAKQESAGSGDYKAISPVNRDGQRAHGRYQVLSSNIPVWTQKYLGQALSVQDFMNSPEAQDKVFEARAKELYKQYGNWEDVAAVWFSGRPLQGNTSSDVTGKTVPQYIKDIQNYMNAGRKKSGSTSLSKLTETTPFMGSTRIESKHPGIDLAGEKGTPIPAVASGKVTGVERNKSGFGNSIIVTDQNGVTYRYSHLNQNYVKVGDSIQRGQNIASMGNTGSVYSTSGGDGTHLDLRIRSASGKYLDPHSFI
jgi:murein DD-endopeptidase MepM/ murein hydrolase activator NlpD